MKKNIIINNKEYSFNVWKIKDEINILFQFQNWIDLQINQQIENISNILIPEAKNLTYLQKLYCLVLVSASANTNLKNITMRCPICDNIIDNYISVNESELVLNESEPVLYKDILIYSKYDKILDDINIKDYNEIIPKLEDNSLKLKTSVKCLICNNDIEITRDENVLFEHYVIQLDINNYYKMLKYFIKEFNFSKYDFDNLYPFEIKLLIGDTNE